MLRPASALVALLLLPNVARAQQALSHIPFCSADSAADSFLDIVRFRVAGTDSASRRVQRAAGLVPVPEDRVNLVVDDSLCIAASGAFARQAPAGHRLVPPFPVAVVRAGDRFLVRLPGERQIAVFDTLLRPLGSF
ncbi:MAG: hypothetical protein U0133_07355 [Gemmatimonadales bacterium]